MLIESIQVTNFRSILKETLFCDELTALVGANGSGKSSFLYALDLFYTLAPRIDAEDFYGGNTKEPITIAVKFRNLSDAAKRKFSRYMQSETLTVERVFTWNEGRHSVSYHGASLQNADFEAVRTANSAKDKKEAYEVLRRANYIDLPAWKKQDDALAALKLWEESHLDKCQPLRDDGQFFGFKEVGNGYLGEFTKFLFIPAVREAADDAAESKGSVLTDLMDMVVRSVLANKAEVRKLKEDTQQKYKEIMQPEKLVELQDLAGKLSTTLRTFVPNASVNLLWLPLNEIRIEMPKADVKLVEDRYPTAVHRAGHGLQRAFVLTMLQHLAMAQSVGENKPEDASLDEAKPKVSEPETKVSLPNLVLAIEEPELYQHPNRQRHMAKILLRLARGSTPGVAEKTQIMYATHSPLFVGLDRFNQIRLCRKVDNGTGKPKVTKLVGTTLDKVAEKVWQADGSKGDKYTGATMINRLHSIITPLVNEGFFADVVVLVEGEDDYAAVMGAARAMNKDIESIGVSVIPVNGKRSMDRPAIIFREFGIPVYLLWDSDGDKGETAGACKTCGKPLDGKPDPSDNHRLLRIVGKPQEDWPEHQEKLHCCFKRDLESTLKAEIGDTLFEKLLGECQSEYAIPKRKHAIKNPAVIEKVIELAQKEGRTSATLQSIVRSILTLAGVVDDKKVVS